MLESFRGFPSTFWLFQTCISVLYTIMYLLGVSSHMCIIIAHVNGIITPHSYEHSSETTAIEFGIRKVWTMYQ